MKYTTLGNSDLKVSRICLGCMGFGESNAGMHSWTLPYEDTKQIIQKAIDSGINFFDTAMGYSGGTSEVFLGKIIRELGVRDKVVIATKYMPKMDAKGGREHIISCLDASLERLGMDYVDLYYMHAWDELTPIEETMETLLELKKAGKIRYAAVSNCFAWQLQKANMIAKQQGWEGFVCVQNHFNLLFREEEREMAKMCRLENIAMAPYSALAAGRLSKHPGETSKRLEQDAYAKGKYDATEQQDLQIIRRVEELAEKYQTSMTAVSVAWLLTRVASPICGVTKPHHMQGLLDAVELELSEEDIKYLEELYVPHRLVGMMVGK